MAEPLMANMGKQDLGKQGLGQQELFRNREQP